MGKHSILSASACERWWNCPGSVTACKDIPNPTSVYAAEGTVAHALAERALRSRPSPDLDKEIGKKVMQEGFEIEITEEMVDAVLDYKDYVSTIWDKTDGALLNYEEEITLDLEGVDVDMFGTSDCSLVVPFKTIHVFDLKFGKGKRVSAWENKQLMYYALGKALKEDCAEIVLHICQPRVSDGFSSYSMTAEDMNQFHEELKIRAKEALDPKAPLVPGDHCRATFCPNRMGCQALQGLAKDLIKSDFSAPAVVDTMALDHIVKVLKYEDTVKDWMTQVRGHAKELMMRGENIPGYKVVQGMGHAKWIDPAILVAEYEDEYGSTLFKPKELLSPAKIEKLVGKKKLGKDFRDEYTYRPDTGFKIVEEDKKGEPVKLIKPQDDF